MRAEEELKSALQEEGGGAFGLAGGQAVGPIDTEPDLDHIFRYHSPSPLDQVRYTNIRETAKFFAKCILNHVPNCADRTAAIRKIREAVMTANSAIALGGRL